MSDKRSMKASDRLKIPRQEMPQQDPHERARRFTEVNLGLPEKVAIIEAERCLQCKNAKCIEGCPVAVDIPAFVAKIAEGDFRSAADVMFRDNLLPGVTGRVCPQETQCEQRCIRGAKGGAPIAIGYLERFIADWARTHVDERAASWVATTGKSVAIVGAGPAGLTAAGALARQGHAVTVFEAFHVPGGVLVYGIPEFRLPNEIVEHEIEGLRAMGVTIETNVVIGQTYSIDELMHEEGFDAVFIANGAGLPIFMGIPGEQLKGVYSANEYLTRVNLMQAYRSEEFDTPVLVRDRVVVVGGGNTAMDAVRTARRLGATHATIVYRRGREEMPARIEEIGHAEEEGVELRLLTNPVRVLGHTNGWVRGVECEQMALGDADASGRRRPVPIEGSRVEIPCDIFIEALGTRANPLLTQTTPDLKVNRWGYIEVDDDGQTSKPGVFAGGDIVRGSATVILAMGDGKRAANAIDRFLKSGSASAQTRAPAETSG